MIATLVALVIGLLVTSAKATFDQANDAISTAGAKMILLDRTLIRYGGPAEPIRKKLKHLVARNIERIWPNAGASPGLEPIENGQGLDELQQMLQSLNPPDDLHRTMRSQCLDICSELLQSRWLLVERSLTELPTPFLVILIIWLGVLFLAFGLLAPRNATTITCLSICALSMALALFLILEMNHPFEGLIQATPAPLRKALSMMK